MDDSVSLLCPYSTFSIFSKSPSPWCYVESTAQVCVYLAFSKEVILFFHGVEAPFVMPIGWFDSIHGQRSNIQTLLLSTVPILFACAPRPYFFPEKLHCRNFWNFHQNPDPSLFFLSFLYLFPPFSLAFKILFSFCGISS